MAVPTTATAAHVKLAPSQKCPKFAAITWGLRPRRNPKPMRARQRCDFGEGEDVLNKGAGTDASRV